ncbi:MAG: sterol desaturase family protein [Gammaproteobacteria bacterium]|nr:sterol desaturase family protein [Gammaproteobacteria bacterium]
MNDFIQQHEMAIRLGFFFGIFILMAVWETLAPRRILSLSKAVRWSNNLSISILNSVLLRYLFPAAAVSMAVLANNQGWGLFNIIDVPFWLAVAASVMLMDFVIYLQHLMMHAVPLLWRLHRVHHADPDFDVTTGVRFHPLEIILSLLIKLAAITILGPSVLAVVIFEVLLNATAMFNHSNIHLPKQLDRVLRRILVTPDMHRVHHSIEDDEANSNFGFNLPWWDHLFRTYRNQPRAGHTNMTLGIRHFYRTKEVSWITGMLYLPFRSKAVGTMLNRRE